MRILISGASGLIGRALTRALSAKGDEPVALVRRAPRQGEVQWNPAEPLDPEKLAGCDAVVHLAGKNIAGRWTEKFKQEVRDSRVQGTRTLANAAAEAYRRTGRPRRVYLRFGDRLLRQSRRRAADGGEFARPRIPGRRQPAVGGGNESCARGRPPGGEPANRRRAGSRWRRTAGDAVALPAGAGRTHWQRTAILELDLAR